LIIGLWTQTRLADRYERKLQIKSGKSVEDSEASIAKKVQGGIIKRM
jgi:hypothetical protein